LGGFEEQMRKREGGERLRGEGEGERVGPVFKFLPQTDTPT